MQHVRYQQAISGLHDVLLHQTETALAIDECLEYFTEKKQKVWKKKTQIFHCKPPKKNLKVLVLCIIWVVPLPAKVANEGLGWDSLLKMEYDPGKGDCYWTGGQSNVLIRMCFLVYYLEVQDT